MAMIVTPRIASDSPTWLPAATYGTCCKSCRGGHYHTTHKCCCGQWRPATTKYNCCKPCRYAFLVFPFHCWIRGQPESSSCEFTCVCTGAALWFERMISHSLSGGILAGLCLQECRNMEFLLLSSALINPKRNSVFRSLWRHSPAGIPANNQMACRLRPIESQECRIHSDHCPCLFFIV